MEKKVAILLGSESDLKYVEASKEYFDHFEIKYEIHILLPIRPVYRRSYTVCAYFPHYRF